MQSYIGQDILEMLDCDDLANAQQVSVLWRDVVVDNQLWKKIYDRNVWNLTKRIVIYFSPPF